MSEPQMHPWHRTHLSVSDRRALRDVEQRLAHEHPEVPVGRIIRMVYGTARLLRSAEPGRGLWAEQVEAACHAALKQDGAAWG